MPLSPSDPPCGRCCAPAGYTFQCIVTGCTFAIYLCATCDDVQPDGAQLIAMHVALAHPQEFLEYARKHGSEPPR